MLLHAWNLARCINGLVALFLFSRGPERIRLNKQPSRLNVMTMSAFKIEIKSELVYGGIEAGD
jgi:hypothetical protein